MFAFHAKNVVEQNKGERDIEKVVLNRGEGHTGEKRKKERGKELDPGSERTLAASLTHASRADVPLIKDASGARVSNT